MAIANIPTRTANRARNISGREYVSSITLSLRITPASTLHRAVPVDLAELKCCRAGGSIIGGAKLAAMAIFDFAMRRKYTADRECTLQGNLSTSNVIGLIVSFLTSHGDHDFEFSNKFTMQYSYPRP
jgi:hypothetical protein